MVTPEPLGGDREAPVLDERARIDQIGDVLARRAPVCGVVSFDRVPTCGVFGERAPPEQCGVVVAERLVGHGVRCYPLSPACHALAATSSGTRISVSNRTSSSVSPG